MLCSIKQNGYANTDYNIDKNNNTLVFIDTDLLKYTIIIVVPIGNYNALTLRDELNYLFKTYTSTDYLECEYNQLDNTYTFTSTDSGLISFIFYGYSTCTIMKVLGFEIKNGDVQRIIKNYPSLTSTQQIDLSWNKFDLFYDKFTNW